MKGIYLTANSWRQGRDVEGWPDKKKDANHKAYEDEDTLEEWVLNEESRPSQSEEAKLSQLSQDEPVDCPSGIIWPVLKL
jgi:hypothetical protein